MYRHQPTDIPLSPPFLRFLQLICRAGKVRACTEIYLLLLGRRSAGDPEAPATGCAAFNMSTAVPALSYIGCIWVTLNTWRSGDDGRPVTEWLQVRF
jgi:hypothetical protein